MERRFSELTVDEPLQPQAQVPQAAIGGSEEKVEEKQPEEVAEKDEMSAQMKRWSERKKCDSFTSSDSDVEILDDEEAAELDDSQELKDNELEVEVTFKIIYL